MLALKAKNTVGRTCCIRVDVFDCDIGVSEFEPLMLYFPFSINTFGKVMYILIPTVMGWIVPLQFFFKAGFGIKYPTKVPVV